MGCKKKKKNCNDTCLGCTYELSSECIFLEEELTCFDDTLPKGTELTEVFAAICEKFEGIEETINNNESEINNLLASDIMVDSLDCIDESDVTGSDLQSVLEDMCNVINELKVLHDDGFTGTFTNGDGDIVTVVNGVITDITTP